MPLSTRSVLIILAVSIAAGAGVRMLDLGQGPWAVSRASGLAAFAVMTLAMVMGLLVSTKAGDGLFSRPFVFEMHQFLSVVSLTLVAVHAGSLVFDRFLQFGSVDLVVPFVSPYRPLAVGAGVIAGWLAVLASASYWMRGRLGQKRWRTLHYVTFVAYLGALWHGIAAGSDTQLPVVYWGYIGSAALVGSLLAIRVSGYRPTPKRRAHAGTAREVAR